MKNIISLVISTMIPATFACVSCICLVLTPAYDEKIELRKA